MSSGAGEVVWQAYVAAIASLAQTLLFLTAILTVCISQIGAQIDVSASKVVVSVDRAESSKRSDRLGVMFFGDSVILDAANKDLLKKELAQLFLNKSTVHVYVKVNANIREIRRLAYLRVLEIRHFMISLGMSPEKIDVAIENGVAANQDDGSKEMTVFISLVPSSDNLAPGSKKMPTEATDL